MTLHRLNTLRSGLLYGLMLVGANVLWAEDDNATPLSKLPAEVSVKLKRFIEERTIFENAREEAEALDPLLTSVGNLPDDLLADELKRAGSLADGKEKELLLDILIAAKSRKDPRGALDLAVLPFPEGAPCKEPSFALGESFARLIAKSPDQALLWLEAHKHLSQALLPPLTKRLFVEDRRYDLAGRIAAFDSRWQVSDDLFNAGVIHREDLSEIVKQLPAMPVGPQVERMAFKVGMGVRAKILNQQQADAWIALMGEQVGMRMLKEQMEKGKTRFSFIWLREGA